MHYSQDTTVCQSVPSSHSLFQAAPLDRELNRDYAHKLSPTSSRESYKNYMQRLIFVLLRYSRPATITVGLNFLKELDAKTLNAITQKTHRRLRKDKLFTAFFINEVTTNGFVPINRLHRHYIIAGTDSIDRDPASLLQGTAQEFGLRCRFQIDSTGNKKLQRVGILSLQVR